jgi:putative colanic acid biosynthesis UDP-glucose lipid carrier transferase
MSASSVLPSEGSVFPSVGGRSSGDVNKARWSRQVAVDIVGLCDAAAVTLAAILPAAIYQIVGGMAVKWPTIIQAALVTALIVHWCMRDGKMYDTNRVHDLPVGEGRILLALALSFTAVLGLGVPFKLGEVHLWIWYGAWFSLSLVLLLTNRLVARSVLRSLTAAGRFDTRVAVFGGGAVARRVRDQLANSEQRIQFAGMFDDRPIERINPEGLEIAGRLEDLIQAAREERVDQIIIALPQGAEQRIAMIARRLEQVPCEVHIVTHIASDLVDSVKAHRVSSLGNVGLLDVKPRPLADWAPMIKRVMDVVLGTLITLVSLPLMALIALAIKLDSNGPVLFFQRRRGLNHRVFSVAKFRTMTVTEDGADIRQATKNDPRVTRVGSFLRRFSLDELPQLLNVLRGDMSLVGPRPHALVHDQEWSEQVERYANRHQVKPGLTGLAQIEGLRGENNAPDAISARVERDLAYIARWSLWLDVRIIASTVVAILTGKNAH